MYNTHLCACVYTEHHRVQQSYTAKHYPLSPSATLFCNIVRPVPPQPTHPSSIFPLRSCHIIYTTIQNTTSPSPTFPPHQYRSVYTVIQHHPVVYPCIRVPRIYSKYQSTPVGLCISEAAFPSFFPSFTPVSVAAADNCPCMLLLYIRKDATQGKPATAPISVTCIYRHNIPTVHGRLPFPLPPRTTLPAPVYTENVIVRNRGFPPVCVLSPYIRNTATQRVVSRRLCSRSLYIQT